MRIAICESEQPYIKDLKKHFSIYESKRDVRMEQCYYPSAEQITAAENAFEFAVIDVANQGVDVIKTYYQLKQNNSHILFIFITSENKYIDEAFELGAVRCLNQPIEPERFYSALDDMVHRFEKMTECLFLNDGIMYDRIYRDDIVYIEIDGRKTKIVTKETIFQSSKNIAYWKEVLLGDNFVTPHNSYVINIDYVTSYKRNRYVVLNYIHIVPVTKNKQNEFNERLAHSVPLLD